MIPGAMGAATARLGFDHETHERKGITRPIPFVYFVPFVVLLTRGPLGGIRDCLHFFLSTM